MNRRTRSSLVMAVATLAFLICQCRGILPHGTALAQSESSQSRTDVIRSAESSGELFDDLSTLVSKISPDLVKQLGRTGDDTEIVTMGAGAGPAKDPIVRAVVQLKQQPSSKLSGFLNAGAVVEKGQFLNFNAKLVELPLSQINALAAFKEVAYISVDRDLQTLGHVETTSGAAIMRQTNSGSLNGSGICIALLDSGLFEDHDSFHNRIVANVNFTGSGDSEDLYGHGTHVAGLAAGASSVSHGNYTGIAPGAKLANLRVLDSHGRGTTSAVMSALDWVMTNRTTYNIRVVNMSLGALAIDSYINDPVCRAVRRLVDAGIVVVAAAGNNGKDSYGNKVYGLIHSPGNEPSAITVGAVNTLATDGRADDTIATYSSRGPTRSYWTDQLGVRHYDNLIKPDLVAPGNKLYSAQAYSRATDTTNYLASLNPQLDNPLIDDEKKDMMMLSGTSMATPVVAGAAALLLQANPSLTPNLVKMILMYTAQPLAGANMFEQGAGEVNIEGAVRLAKLVRTNLTSGTVLGSPLLTSATPPSPVTTIVGQTFTWGQGIIARFTYATGANLITQYQKTYGLGVALGDGIVISNGILLCNTNLMSSGILLGDNILTSRGVVLGDGWPLLPCGMLLGDGILLGDGVLLGDGILLGDGMLLGDGVLLGDCVSQSSIAQINGDAGPGMPASP